MLSSSMSRAVVLASTGVRAGLVPARKFAHTTWISGFPRQRVSFPEKLAHMTVITACVLAFPAYVLTHLEDYKKGGFRE